MSLFHKINGNAQGVFKNCSTNTGDDFQKEAEKEDQRKSR
jgi:hypothetical protein